MRAATVTDANGLIDALQNGTATTINVANDINLGSVTDAQYTEKAIKNKRDIVIQSATDGVKHTIDFAGYSFDMNTQNSVTFKDLNLYDRSYWGIIYNAGGYVFDNVDFTGSQLVYTKPSINSTVTFKNNVNATAVGSYVGPLDGKTRTSQGGNTQQILQFEGGNNQIIFASGSTVTLTTTNSNVLEIDDGTTTIDVQNGANVTIDPHSKGNPEPLNGIGMRIIARAIASKGTTNLNIDKGATLNINLVKDASYKDLSGALYLNSGATLNVNGNLNINSAGQSNYGQLSAGDQVSIYAAKDFVPSDTQGPKSVNEWMAASYKTELKDLVDEAPTIEKSSNYTAAGSAEQTSYTNAISSGQAVLDNQAASSDQIQAAIQAITAAKKGLNGDLNTAKQALQDAVNAQEATQQTAAYYNADTTKQQAYDGAITAGKAALAVQDPTVASLTAALAAINTAKSALDGQATDTSKLEAAVNNAATVEAGNDYKNASADVQKQYTDAVDAGQALLNQTTLAPTQAAVDAAAKAITDVQAALTTSAAANIEHSQRTARASLNSALSAAIQAIDADTNLTET